jgi:hypothetical protein
MEFMKIVPADVTIAELQKKAAETDSRKQPDTQTKHSAELCREWIWLLRSGKWLSLKNLL